MDFKTASSITRAPWFIDEQWAATYYEELIKSRTEDYRFRANQKGDEKVEAEHPRQKFFANDNVKFAPDDAWTKYAAEFTGFEGATVAIIPLSGPLMKADYCGYYGTQAMLSFFRLAEQTESVKEIVLLIDSPGGTVDGTSNFADAVKASTKEVTTIINGLCASAALWIGSSAPTVIATSKTDIVGSIGTMIQMVDKSKYYEEMGIIVRTYNATESKDKNRAYTEALAGDGKLLIKTLLDPLNNEFVSAIKENRDGKIVGNEVLTGKTYVAKDALAHGLIDEISTYENAINAIVSRNTVSPTPQIQVTMKWTKILSFLGIKPAATAADVTMTEEHLDKAEALINEKNALVIERDNLTQQLEAANTARTKAEGELATAQGTIQNQAAEILKLKAEDEKPETPEAPAADPAKPAGAVDANEMSFQKELLSKVL